MFWAMDKPGIPTMSKKITEDVSSTATPAETWVCLLVVLDLTSIGNIWMVPILTLWANEAFISFASAGLF